MPLNQQDEYRLHGSFGTGGSQYFRPIMGDGNRVRSAEYSRGRGSGEPEFFVAYPRQVSELVDTMKRARPMSRPASYRRLQCAA
jgi:hypothetical protein